LVSFCSRSYKDRHSGFVISFIRLPRRSEAKAGHSPATPKPDEGGRFVMIRQRSEFGNDFTI
jgi:hypothetical protein